MRGRRSGDSANRRARFRSKGHRRKKPGTAQAGKVEGAAPEEVNLQPSASPTIWGSIELAVLPV
jgi:hypothetical protein